jgi:hypothetical protein
MGTQHSPGRARTIEVSFGRSESGPKVVKKYGVSYSQTLREAGWRPVKRYNHGTAELGVVAVKNRWEHPSEDRVFTSYRVRQGVPIPLLFAAEVAEAEEVWVSESHSDAEALREAGVTATTNWGSASEWSDDYAEQLRDKDVIVVRHRDPAGHCFAAGVVKSLLGVARCVTVVEPYAGNDARDHLDAGHGLGDFVEVHDA